MNLVDVAGTHRQQEITGAKSILQNHHKLVKRGGKFRKSSLLLQSANQFLRDKHGFVRHLFARGKHRCNPHAIGRSEALGKFIH